MASGSIRFWPKWLLAQKASGPEGFGLLLRAGEHRGSGREVRLAYVVERQHRLRVGQPAEVPIQGDLLRGRLKANR